MKKTISIVLSFLILVSSFFTASVFGNSAEIDFENADNWILNKEGSQIDSYSGAIAPADWQSVTVNTNADFVKDGTSSVKLYNNFQLASIYLDGLEADSTYTLSYEYLTPTLYVTSKGETYSHAISYTGIFMPEKEGATAKKAGDGWLDIVTTSEGRTTTDGVYANGTVDSRNTSGVKANEWSKVELKFSTKNDTKLALVLFLNTVTIYLDNFTLIKTENEKVDENTDKNLIINGDFKDDSNFDTTTKNYKGTTENYGKWINYNTGISNFAYSATEGVNGGGAAKATIPSSGYLRSFGQVLSVEKNTDYILTFKSKGNLDGKVNAGAFKVQSAHATSSIAISSDAFITLSASEEWVEYTLEFNSGNRTAFWVGFGGMDDATPGLYYLIDDVGLYKASDVSLIEATAEDGGSVVGGGYYARGGKATIIATPAAGYDFDGWYMGEAKVSSSAAFEVTASEDGSAISYIAKFKESYVDPDELLYDGGFDNTTSVSSAESYDTVTYESAHIWYKPPCSSSIIEENGNKVAQMKSWLCQSVKIEEDTSYLLSFKAKNTNDGVGIVPYIKNLRNRAQNLVTASTVKLSSDGEWNEYSVVIKVGKFLSGVTDYILSLDCVVGNTVLIDDISFKKLENYTITAVSDGGGTATADKVTAEKGEKVKFTAVPNKDFTFVGWFRDGESAAVSTDLIYETTADGNITLHAKFSYDGVIDPDELLYDGGFNLTEKISSAESYDTVTYESAHIWYMPPSGSSVQTEDGNKVLKLASWAYQSVKVKENTTYVLSFKAKNTSDSEKTLAVYLRNLKNRSQTLVTASPVAITADGEWNEYAVIIQVNSFISSVQDYVLGMHCGDNNSILMDDISLKVRSNDIFEVGTSTFRGGSAKASSYIAKAGSQITFTATPDEGNTFVGWFLRGSIYAGAISTEPVFTTVITEDTKLLAVFGGDKYPATTYSWSNPDAETGDTSHWHTLSENTSFTVTDDKNEVYDGDYSFKLTANGDKATMITDEAILLKGNHRYTISCYVKADNAIRLRPFLSTSAEYRESVTDYVYQAEGKNIRDDLSVFHIVGNNPEVERWFSSMLFTSATKAYDGNKDGWVKYTMYFDLLPDYDGDIVYFALQCRTGDGYAYLDNLTVTEEKLDMDPQKSDKLYGEWAYDLLGDGDFEEPLSEGSFSTVPDGYTLADKGAYEGNGYLNIAANSGAYVKKITVTQNRWYYLDYNVKTLAKGNSYIGITFDEPDNEGDFSDPAKMGISAFYLSTNGEWQRDGIKFVSQYGKEAYIVIYSGTNALQIDNMELFKDIHASETDPNNPTLFAEYDYEGDGILYDEYDLKYANMGAESADGENPETGDAVYPAVMLGISLAAVFTLLCVSNKSKRRAK